MRKKLPEFGDKRKVKRFALIPVITTDRHKVWLEHYISEEEFKDHQGKGRWHRLSSEIMKNSVDFIVN